MKKLFLVFLFLLIATPVYSFNVGMFAGKSSTGGPLTDSCSGTLLLSWHCENANVTLGGVTGGVNNGCSVGVNKVATFYSGANIQTVGTPTSRDGTGVCAMPTTQDYVTIPWAADIVDPAQGRIEFWFYASGFGSVGYPFLYFPYTDADNFITLTFTTGYALRIDHKAGGVARAFVSTLVPVTGVYNHYVARWSKGKTGDSTNYMQLCMDTTETPTTCQSYASADLGTWSGSTGTVQFGTSQNANQNYYFDKIKIYNHWSN